MTVKGRDLKNGLAREATLTSEELMEVLRRPARQIMDKVLDVLESTTPELVADIARNGIVLTGGGSQLFGMDRLLCERTEMTCVVADDADSCAAYRCGKSLSWMNHMQGGHDQPRPPPPAEGVRFLFDKPFRLKKIPLFSPPAGGELCGLFEITPRRPGRWGVLKNRDRRKPPIPAFSISELFCVVFLDMRLDGGKALRADHMLDAAGILRGDRGIDPEAGQPLRQQAGGARKCARRSPVRPEAA